MRFNFFTKQLCKLGVIKLPPLDKLHLGCGHHYLSGWTNIDRYAGDIQLDITKPLPFTDESVQFIYHAQIIEHFTIEQNCNIFAECRRVMRKGGCLRILYPDLYKHCLIYLNNDPETLLNYKREGLIIFDPEKFKYSPLTEWLNRGFYDFEHKFIPDRQTIGAIAREAGFTDLNDVTHGRSRFKELQNIDYYPDTDKLFSIIEICK